MVKISLRDIENYFQITFLLQKQLGVFFLINLTKFDIFVVVFTLYTVDKDEDNCNIENARIVSECYNINNVSVSL